MKNTLETSKTALEVLKQAFIVAVLAALIFYPSLLGEALEKVGIQEGDIWGLKWKRSLQATDKELVELQAENRDLIAQLQETNETVRRQSELLADLQAAPTEGPGPQADYSAVIESANEVVEQNLQAVERAEMAGQSAQQRIVANTPLVDRAEDDDLSEGLRFAVVAGGDRTEAAARDELMRAKRAGFDSTKIFMRQNSYRTVITFPDRSSAVSSLPSIKSQMNRPDAYIVDLRNWCPSAEAASDDLIVCN